MKLLLLSLICSLQVFANNDKNCRLWLSHNPSEKIDLRTSKPMEILRSFQSSDLRDIQFSPNGKYLRSSFYTFSPRHTYFRVPSLDRIVPADIEIITLGSGDKFFGIRNHEVIEFNAADGKVRVIADIGQQRPSFINVAGNRAVVTSSTRLSKLVDLDSGATIGKIKFPERYRWVFLQPIPNTNLVLLTSRTTRVTELFDFEKEEFIRSYGAQVQLRSDSVSLLRYGRDGVSEIDLHSNQENWKGMISDYTWASQGPNLKSFVVMDSRGQVHLLDFLNNTSLQLTEPVRAFDVVGSNLLVHSDQKLSVLNLDTLKVQVDLVVQPVLSPKGENQNAIEVARMSPDGKYVFLVVGKTVEVWERIAAK